MPSKLRDLLGALAAIALGVAGYFVVFGTWPLFPSNIAFLDHGDRAMHTLGWMFYRDAPWGMPPGSSAPRLGIELANSIALVDGLPLFAIPAKLLSAWLPQPFQYWGYWWLLCFALQALFAYLLAIEMGARRTLALLAAGFAIITPAFIFRPTLHMALAGHWLLLAGLWLYARRKPPRLYAWPLLLALTATVHAYLLAMQLAIWIAAWIARTWSRKLPIWNGVFEVLLAVGATALTLWAAGFFYTGSLGSYGFGFYRLNVLWPLISYGDWSAIFPALPHGEYDYEGLSFLGVGIMAILALSIVTGAVLKLRVLASPRWLPLVIVAICLSLCALSNHIGLLDLEAPEIKIDGWMRFLGETFRSSGRFIWPLLYLVTVGAVVLLGRRLWPGWGLVIITACFAWQVVDSQRGWSAFARFQPRPADHWVNPLSSPFWERAAAAGYSRIRAIPVIYRNLDWRALEYVAYLNHQQVDSIYLGRVDDKALDALKAKEERALETGDFEAGTIYILDVITALRLQPLLRPGDLLGTIDNRIVFARGGAALVDGLGIDPRDGR
ncbi:MAG: DUF6311 domain-containing protein [Devosia sp.]